MQATLNTDGRSCVTTSSRKGATRRYRNTDSTTFQLTPGAASVILECTAMNTPRVPPVVGAPNATHEGIMLVIGTPAESLFFVFCDISRLNTNL
jgi:hypothetical protein